MRCVECLPLIEEFFDGETDERTAEQIGAHLAACADCAAALDALSFEQEIYARYDRGLEVSPALWSAVSAEIARTPKAEGDAPHQNFLSRLRDGFAETLSAFTLRPAFTSALALLVVGVAVGSLWLVRTPNSEGKFVAASTSNGTAAATPSHVGSVVPNNTDGNGDGGKHDGTIVASASPSEKETKHNAPRLPSGHDPKPTPSPDDAERLLEFNPQLGALTKGTVNIPADDHAATDNSVEIVNAGLVVMPNAPAVAPLLDPAQKELARHVEQAQMLLRSIKNARAADDGTVNVAYEKKLSRRLLAENATLQLDAETRGDSDGKQVLDRIEPFLLDIANLSDNPSREEVHSVRERMKQNEIIASLQVY
jgi:hypothetical protein